MWGRLLASIRNWWAWRQFKRGLYRPGLMDLKTKRRRWRKKR